MLKPHNGLYSGAYKSIDLAKLSGDIQRAITYLKQHTEVVEVYQVAQGKMYGRQAIVVAVKVDLGAHFPPRYKPDVTGINEKEQVLFLFDPDRYPEEPPHVGSDRRDFKWEGKPHVSPAGPNTPPLFCLSRVPLKEWFAAHSFPEFYDRTIDWLLDAAHERLQREDGRFEPTMAWSSWVMFFDYEVLAAQIQKKKIVKTCVQIAQFEFIQPTQQTIRLNQLTFRYGGPISEQSLSFFIKQFENQTHGQYAQGLPGLVCSTPPGCVSKDVFASLPQNREDFIEWTNGLGIDLTASLEKITQPYERLATTNLTRIAFFPILIAIERPSSLFGVETNIEIIPFVLVIDRAKQTDSVITLQHQYSMTPNRAQHLSRSVALEKKVILLGAGALGSKLFSHWYRSGHTKWTIVDSDILLPHNPVRHALSASSVGLSKSRGLRQMMEGLYEGVKVNQHVKIFEKDLHDALLDKKFLRSMTTSIVIDTTASKAVVGSLISKEAPRIDTLVRGVIVDEGRKAILFLEGVGRNPRIDDLQTYLYYLGTTDTIVKDWLMRRDTQEDESLGIVGSEIELGVACASDSLRLADDVVSYHAGQISLRLKEWLSRRINKKTSTEPRQIDSYAQIGLSDLELGWRQWEVPTFSSFQSNEWFARISSTAQQSIMKLLEEHAPHETGGILVGRVDHIRQIVYVVDALAQPPDSDSSKTKFVRGNEGVQEALEQITQETGDTIGYVAEWHTHPNGPSNPSQTDYSTIEKTAERFRPSHFPTVMVIASPKNWTVIIKDPLS